MKLLIYQGRPTGGGSKKSLFNLTNELRKYMDVIYVCGAKGWFTEELNKKSINWISNPEINLQDKFNISSIKSKYIRKLISTSFIFILGLKVLFKNLMIIKSNKVDYVLLNETRDFFFLGIPLLLNRNTKGISYVRGELDFFDFPRLLVSTKIVSLSSNLIDGLPKPLKKKSVVIPNFIEVEDIQNYQRSDKNIINIAFVGSIIPVKGLEHLIEIVSKMVSSNNLLEAKICINIYGDTPKTSSSNYKKSMIELIEKKNLTKSFVFHGWVKDVQSQLKKNDILVLTSNSEGLPRAIMEAMACSLPIIAFNVGGVSDLVREGKNGFLIRYNDYERFSEMLTELVLNSEEREIMGKMSKRIILEEFSRESVICKTRELLES